MKQPRVGIVRHSDSFSAVWPELAAAAGCEVVELGTGAEPPPASSPGPAPGGGPPVDARELACILVAAAGAEDEALAALPELGARYPGLPLAVVTAATGHRLAVEALRRGAVEYFALPGDVPLVRAWIHQRVAAWKERALARGFVTRQLRFLDGAHLVGESAAWLEVLARAEHVIPVPGVPVLVTGETGTGKQLLAQAIHYQGPRAAGPFVEINCAALPATLLEAEVFGYEKGAFTDARTAKPGLFEAAAGGTLFLDEIGELAPDLQAKLLKVLEDRRVRRLGGVRTVPVDVRVVAATHVDLPARVRERGFRGDLYYRLSVATLRLPPLRERGDDVLLLAEVFLDRLAAEYAVPRPPLNPRIRKALMRHPWPGNVRELRNSIARALLFGGGSLEESALFEGGEGAVEAPAGGGIGFPTTLREAERALAAEAVERLQGNKARAAQVLGISRKKLYQLLGPQDPPDRP